MYIAELWRYPVKSLAGERLERADLRLDGIAGDRVVHVVDARGRVVTSRTHPRLLGLHGTFGADGEPEIGGLPWSAAQSAGAIESAVGDGVRLVRYDGPERFDILPLLVCTDGAVASFGRDVRRLRPNLVVRGVDGSAERSWEGGVLKLPRAAIGVADLRGRCVMTTYDPDTGEQDPGVLRDIVHRFGGRLCLNAHVVRPGVLQEGDAVELLPHEREIREPG